tara:strand:+ start:1523 stop:2326 length:804 start_codon:yes stop_codon:yes gene_type:complete
MAFFYSWVQKWAYFVVSLHEALDLFVKSMVSGLIEERQSFRSIVQVISAQVYFTGVQAMPFVAFSASLISFAVMLQANFQMSLWGSTDLPGFLYVTIVFRELSIIVPSIFLVARSGSAIASELAAMRVNREIDALKIMGIHPYSYIVFPRIVGGFISLLGLAIYFNIIGIVVAGLSVNLLFDMDSIHLISMIFDEIVMIDVLIFFVKILLSAAIIFTVCALKGLKVQKSNHEIPQATMSAVISSLLYVCVFHLMFTAIFYVYKLRLI